MFTKAHDWTPEALAAAGSELQRRGLPVPEASPPPRNFDHEILPDGRKRFLRATMVDVLVSLFLPSWGLIVGFMALLKGEGKRGLTMMGLGIVSVAVVVYLRQRH